MSEAVLSKSSPPRLQTQETVWARMKKHKWCYIFLLPSAIMYLGFALWPLIANVYFSLFDWNGIGWPEQFIGIKNYFDLLSDPYFWNAMKNTFLFALGQTGIKLPLALFLAVLLNSPKLKGKSIYRAVFFLPVVTTTAIIGIVMTFIFNPYSGAANGFLQALGIIKQPIEFLGVKTAMIIIILIEAWKMTGQYMIYWLAGLQAIPQELYEAAEVDGANPIQKFFHVTVPLLKPVAAIIVLFGLVYALRIFDLVMVMTGGGPDYATDVMATYIYRHAFSAASAIPRIGFASAAGVAFTIVLMVFAVVQQVINKRAKRERGEE